MWKTENIRYLMYKTLILLSEELRRVYGLLGW